MSDRACPPDSHLILHFADAPSMNPARALGTGSVCGVKVQEVEDSLMREIRILDKLIDELAKGRALERICLV